MCRPSDLSEFARAVIGLRLTGIQCAKQQSRLLYSPMRLSSENPERVREGQERLAERIRSLWSLLAKSRHPVVRYVLKEGIPAGYGATLGKSCRCRKCGGRINVVPCQKCATASDDPLLVESSPLKPLEAPDPQDRPLKKAKQPTTHSPGTALKIEVMRNRIEQGQSPFHPLDPVKQTFATWFDALLDWKLESGKMRH